MERGTALRVVDFEDLIDQRLKAGLEQEASVGRRSVAAEEHLDAELRTDWFDRLPPAALRRRVGLVTSDHKATDQPSRCLRTACWMFEAIGAIPSVVSDDGRQSGDVPRTGVIPGAVIETRTEPTRDAVRILPDGRTDLICGSTGGLFVAGPDRGHAR